MDFSIPAATTIVILIGIKYMDCLGGTNVLIILRLAGTWGWLSICLCVRKPFLLNEQRVDFCIPLTRMLSQVSTQARGSGQSGILWRPRLCLFMMLLYVETTQLPRFSFFICVQKIWINFIIISDLLKYHILEHTHTHTQACTCLCIHTHTAHTILLFFRS